MEARHRFVTSRRLHLITTVGRNESTMRYQLLLQFRGDSLVDYDAIAALEDELIEKLPEADVDGHDVGSGETNIFIFTADPVRTFQQAKPVLERR
jgi:hypothetical protein